MKESHSDGNCVGDFYAIDCLSNGAPHESSVAEIVSFFKQLEDKYCFCTVRIQFVLQLFCRMLKMRYQQYSIQDYSVLLQQELINAKAHAESISCFSDMLGGNHHYGKSKTVIGATQKHFSTMFCNFSDDDFYELSPANLEKLFNINKFVPSTYGNTHALDAGCGSGRYSYALHKWFQKVTGIDFSMANIEFAKKKIAEKKISEIDFKVGDVTNLPFEENTFDFVFSNGVLHHVDAPYPETLSELYRVLKPNGGGYLYIMEKPGGILNDTIEICRFVLKDVPESMTLCMMQQMGFSGYRIYAVLDHVYAPINIRTRPRKIEKHLLNAGFKNIQRFSRGLPSDDIERLFFQSSDTESVWKLGVGENRYTFNK